MTESTMSLVPVAAWGFLAPLREGRTQNLAWFRQGQLKSCSECDHSNTFWRVIATARTLCQHLIVCYFAAQSPPGCSTIDQISSIIACVFVHSSSSDYFCASSRFFSQYLESMQQQTRNAGTPPYAVAIRVSVVTQIEPSPYSRKVREDARSV